MRRPLLKHGLLHFICRRLKLGHRGRKRSVLPRELWEKIYERLPTTDRIRFASVSNNWLSIATTKPPPPPVLDPWLMFRGANEFWSLSQNRFYRFDNINPTKKKHEILGASDGWLLITEHPGPEVTTQKSLILVNPISNAKILLPPIEYTQIQDMKKLVVVTLGDSVVPARVYIRTRMNYLYLDACIRYNRTWINHPMAIGYSDDVLVYDGKLYNLTVRRSKTSSTIVINVRSLNDAGGEHTYNVVEHKGFSGFLEAYLVQSCGDLLLVKRFHQRKFEVFKLVLVDEESLARCVELESLEQGQALFWGRDGCVSVPVGKFSSFEENHIYFSVKRLDQSYEIGAYSLKDNSIGKSFKEKHNVPQQSLQQESAWFFPKIKDTFC
ncbi:hypothetical protein ACLB2K_044015 [Fragaria x ananassa]